LWKSQEGKKTSPGWQPEQKIKGKGTVQEGFERVGERVMGVDAHQLVSKKDE